MCRTTAVAGNIQHWAEYSLPARPIYHPASCAENDWSYGRLDAPKEFCLLGSRAPDVERDYPPHPTHQAPRSPLSIADIDPANEPLAIFEVRPHPEAGVVLLSHRHTSTRARLRPGELCIEAALPGGGAGWDDSGACHDWAAGPGGGGGHCCGARRRPPAPDLRRHGVGRPRGTRAAPQRRAGGRRVCGYGRGCGARAGAGGLHVAQLPGRRRGGRPALRAVRVPYQGRRRPGLIAQAHIENLKAELAAKGELATTVACTHARTP